LPNLTAASLCVFCGLYAVFLLPESLHTGKDQEYELLEANKNSEENRKTPQEAPETEQRLLQDDEEKEQDVETGVSKLAEEKPPVSGRWKRFIQILKENQLIIAVVWGYVSLNPNPNPKP
jgi:predicted nucleotide-binding protein (sugar kinase/HSP70/actin superfamily)